MSRDATGIYSAWAVEASTCPVCRAGKGEACDLDVPGYTEHGTHWERTETAPSYPPPDPARSLAIDLVFMRRDSGELSDAEEELIEAYREKLTEFAAQVLEAAEAPARAMAEAKAASMRRIRDAFHETYGSFWKCGSCGGYIGPRPPGETAASYVCAYCGSTDTRAHGYSYPGHAHDVAGAYPATLAEVHAPGCDPDAYNGCVQDCPTLKAEREAEGLPPWTPTPEK